MERWYLRPDAVVRPLVNQWAAWDALIPPHSMAFHFQAAHVPILESYIRSPAEHAAAALRPELVGGPWADFGRDRSAEARLLLEQTKREQAPLIEFGNAIRTIETLLRSEAKGASLESFYPRVPEPLRGYVQLVYDLNDSPSLLFHEGMLYQSPLYQAVRQSVAIIRLTGDDRPFQWSTPLLEDDTDAAVAQLPIRFADERIDFLSDLTLNGRPQEEISSTLGWNPSADQFKSFFTTEPPRRVAGPEAGQVRVRYFGHACVLVQTSEVSLLTDPFLSYEVKGATPRYTLCDLPDVIDYVLITHCHSDHVELETLLRLRPRIRNVVVPRSAGGRREDPNLRLLLKTIGFKNVIELHDMEEILDPRVRVTAIPFVGEHSDLALMGRTTYVVSVHGRKLFFAVDSQNLETKMYERIGEKVHAPDILFLGMECEGAPITWGYGPLFTRRLDPKNANTRRDRASNCNEGMAIVSAIQPRKVVVYAMGQEPWLNHVMGINQSPDTRPASESREFLRRLKEIGVDVEKPFGMAEYLFGA